MMRAPLLAIAALGLSGCFFSSSDGTTTSVGPAIPADGTLTVDWTINGGKDPNQCNQAQAVAIQITVTTTAGGFAGTFQQQCQTFATSITLAPGAYTAQAELLDPGGQPRTTSVPINPFTIRGNDELVIPIDFPASSFF